MDYAIYKFHFPGEVHFGEKTLESASFVFLADRLFSALAMEAAKESHEKLAKLVRFVAEGKLLFSDAFPFRGEEYFCVKPMIRPQHTTNEEDIAKRKFFKKLTYIPFSKLSVYLSGKAQAEELETPSFGRFALKTSVNLSCEDAPLPYRVGTFFFYENCGLYVLVGYEDAAVLSLAEELMGSLSHSGIGGKRSSGMGRFKLSRGQIPAELSMRLGKDCRTYTILSTALPVDEDMPAAVDGARFLLEKRSGFVASPAYAEEWRRKQDVFAFKSGSCFTHKWRGQVRDVSNGGHHSVYRYLMPIFMGVD